MKKKILICDDSPEVGESFKKKVDGIDTIKDSFEPILISPDDLEEAVNALDARRQAVIKNNIKNYPDNDPAKIIDEATILIIDYALYDLNAPVTGERIAYLARCYSKCGFIVALNQFPPYNDEYFDLTLRGHLESYADLNIPSDSLANHGLWSEPWNNFRPWSWPLLLQAAEKYNQRIVELKGNLKSNILEFLGFVGDKSLSLPRSAVEFISRENPGEMTFRKFVESTGSGNGLRGREEQPINDEAIARIAAARISCWLEYYVLPGQNILVDAPHLISRFPSLLGEKVNDIEYWNRIATLSEPDIKGLSSSINRYLFNKSNWLSRPVWFWNDLINSEEIKEVRDPWSTPNPGFVFCEDISKFMPIDDVRSFVADLESPFVRRYVKHLEPPLTYTPIVRFSL